jgi:hypothetical protein
MRKVLTAVLLAISSSQPTAGQHRAARSLDYLFTTNASDARATWVNPAGLGAVMEASVMGEITAGRNTADEFKLLQWTAGFNSRGLSVAYLSNRFEQSASTSALRVAMAVPVSRGAFGFAVTNYAGPGENRRGIDLGIQYGPARILTVAGVVRHILRPTVGPEQLAIEVAGGGLLSLAGGTLQFSGEALGVERLAPAEEGLDFRYRAGGRLSIPMRRRFDLIAAADLGSNLRIDRFHFGLAIGGRSQVGVIATGVTRDDRPVLDRLSLHGNSSRVLMTR